jgi:predicted ferric reductase
MATTIGPGIGVAPHAHLSQHQREAVVLAPIVLCSLIVGALWWSSLPPTGLSTTGTVLEAVGRTTGLEGTFLALVVVVLLARLAWLDRFIGMDRLAVWHRRFGEATVVLLSVHAVAIVWGYAAIAHTNVISETPVVVLSYPDVLAATVGLGLFLLVAGTSVRAARRRIAHHTWYFVHLYTYLALALSFAHQLATGNELSGNLAARVVWSGLYVGVLGLVLVCRVGLPLRSALVHRLVVDRVVDEGPGVVSIWFRGRRLHELHAAPGQFFLWRFLTGSTWWQAHPFSLSAAPDGRHLRVTVKAAGDHTSWLQKVPIGTRVMAEGPYGAFTTDRRRNRHVLLLAAGVGIAPLRAIFESIHAEPGALTLLYRARTESDLVLRSELEDIATRRGARIAFVVGRRPAGRTWPTADALRTAVGPALRDHDVFLCGPPGFMEASRKALREAGVPRRHVHGEDFAL